LTTLANSSFDSKNPRNSIFRNFDSIKTGQSDTKRNHHEWMMDVYQNLELKHQEGLGTRVSFTTLNLCAIHDDQHFNLKFISSSKTLQGISSHDLPILQTIVMNCACLENIV
jgi:hypothetical protein